MYVNCTAAAPTTTTSTGVVVVAGVQKLSEREYLGTVQACKVSADYAAVRFDSRVNLHMVSYFTVCQKTGLLCNIFK